MKTLRGKNLTPLPDLIKSDPESVARTEWLNERPPPGQRRGVLFEDMYRGGRGRKVEDVQITRGVLKGEFTKDGMTCPRFRLSSRTVVEDTRWSERKQAVRRRRKCLGCRERFTTYEVSSQRDRMVLWNKTTGGDDA